MGFFSKRKTETPHAHLDSLVHDARTGDALARSELLEAYSPFVLRVASQTAKRYIHKEQDDEFSIALMAMNEAIDRFDPDKNASFLNFADTVIKRRLIDYFRSQQSNRPVSVWSEFEVRDDEDNVVNYAEVESAVTAHSRSVETTSRQEEISEYGLQLAGFNLQFHDLVQLAPKHADARKHAMEVARLITADEALRTYVWSKKSLPLKDLEQRTALSRKTLERQRKYIIAIVVLLTGDYPYLQEYIR